jgi:hypothetical protein
MEFAHKVFSGKAFLYHKTVGLHHAEQDHGQERPDTGRYEPFYGG